MKKMNKILGDVESFLQLGLNVTKNIELKFHKLALGSDLWKNIFLK